MIRAGCALLPSSFPSSFSFLSHVRHHKNLPFQINTWIHQNMWSRCDIMIQLSVWPALHYCVVTFLYLLSSLINLTGSKPPLRLNSSQLLWRTVSGERVSSQKTKTFLSFCSAPLSSTRWCLTVWLRDLLLTVSVLDVSLPVWPRLSGSACSESI